MSKNKEEKTLIFQDVVNEQVNDAEALSLAFFELANVPIVGYRLLLSNDAEGTTNVITVRQDLGCTTHTGGIVWETSYLLLNYLLQQDAPFLKKSSCRILEVGAGCGLLGQVLAATSPSKVQVVMTECDLVMENLESNLQRNLQVFEKNTKNSKPPIACTLDWLNYKQQADTDGVLQPHSFDLIVGTDVVFCTELVKPLLKTLRYYASNNNAVVVYLCLQVRCEDSHALLLKLAPQYGWIVTIVDLSEIPSCAWGLQMECILLKMTRSSSAEEEECLPTKKKKKRKATTTTTNEEEESKKKKKKRKKHNA